MTSGLTYSPLSRELGDTQELLRDATIRFIETTCPMSQVRSLCDRATSVGPDYYLRAADLGWTAMLVPEDDGGSYVPGEGMTNAVVVAIERGRRLQPGLFVPMCTAAIAIASDGDEEQRKGVLGPAIRGETCVSWAWAGMVEPGGFDGGLVVTGSSSGFRINGTVDFVQDLDASRWLLLSTPFNGVTQFLIPIGLHGIVSRPMRSMDLTRSFFRVHFEDVLLPGDMVLGEIGGGAPTFARQFDVGLVLTCAESIGAMARNLELAVSHAKNRVAFGRPIGSFQAIKHLLADASLIVEEAQAITWAACEAIESGGQSSALAGIAKAFVGEAGLEIAQYCLQVFGGVGFTWDHDQHLYLRRLSTDSALYGDPTWHRERLLQMGGL